MKVRWKRFDPSHMKRGHWRRGKGMGQKHVPQSPRVKSKHIGFIRQRPRFKVER